MMDEVKYTKLIVLFPCLTESELCRWRNKNNGVPKVARQEGVEKELGNLNGTGYVLL